MRRLNRLNLDVSTPIALGQVVLFAHRGVTKSGRLCATFLAAAALLVSFCFGPLAHAQAERTEGGTSSQDAIQACNSHLGAMNNAMLMAMMCMQYCSKGENWGCICAMLAIQQANSLQATAATACSGGKQLSGSQNPKLTEIPKVGTKLSEIKDRLTKQGIKVLPNGKSASLPNGNTFPLDSSALTPAGMKEAGLDSSQIAAGQSLLAGIHDQIAQQAHENQSGKAKDKELSVDGANSGGSGGSYGASASGGGYSSRPPSNSNSGIDGKISGMSKNFGGDKIGVSGDDIFEMISRRYKANQSALKE